MSKDAQMWAFVLSLGQVLISVGRVWSHIEDGRDASIVAGDFIACGIGILLTVLTVWLIDTFEVRRKY